MKLNNNILKASKVVGCGLVRQHSMPFDFGGGACNTFQVPEENVMICFGNSGGLINANTCYQ